MRTSPFFYPVVHGYQIHRVPASGVDSKWGDGSGDDLTARESHELPQCVPPVAARWRVRPTVTFAWATDQVSIYWAALRVAVVAPVAGPSTARRLAPAPDREELDSPTRTWASVFPQFVAVYPVVL